MKTVVIVFCFFLKKIPNKVKFPAMFTYILDTIAMQILSPKIGMNEIFSKLFFINLCAQTGIPASKALWIRHCCQNMA